MAKNSGKRYTDAERAAIIADMERNGLTQAAAAKKHRVSAVTIWSWSKAAKRTTPVRGVRVKRGRASANGTLDAMLHAEVRERIRDSLPEIVREKVAAYITRVLV